MKHVTYSKALWSSSTVTVDGTASAEIDVAGFIEGRFFIDGDVVTGTWTPKLQNEDPRTGVWVDRVGEETFSPMTPDGGAGDDGLAQTETVKVSNLGSKLRMVLVASVAPSPEISITVTFEGKT